MARPIAAGPSEETLQVAAKMVAVAYLVAMATSIFAEAYVRGTLIVPSDVLATARNIAQHRTLFRVGVAFEIATFITDIGLIAALYVILSTVQRPLALFAALLRMAAETIALVMAADSFHVVRLLSSAAHMKAFSEEEIAALVQVHLSAHDTQFGVVFLVMGIGSTVFGYLWHKSRHIPKGLALLAIGSSALLSAGALAILMVPRLITVLYPWYMIPLFFFEVGIGVWLLVKGLRLGTHGAGNLPLS